MTTNSPHAFMIFDSVPTKPSQVLPVAGFKPSCRKNPRRWHAELDPCFWAWPKLWAATMLPPCIRSNVNRQASTSNRHLKATDEGVTVAARIVHVWPTKVFHLPLPLANGLMEIKKLFYCGRCSVILCVQTTTSKLEVATRCWVLY